MRNIVFIISLALVFSLGIVMAEETNTAATPSLLKIHIMGGGIAVNPSELTDFKIIKSVVSTFKYENGTSTLRGAIVIDQVRYVVTGEVSENGTKFVGEVLKNETKVGDLSLVKTEKPDAEVWVGTLSLDGTSYYTYITGVLKSFTAKELGLKLGEYCKDNPDDEKCKGVAFVCGTENIGQCKDKIAAYCESHPSDSRCKVLSQFMCKNNSDDTRCRQYLRTACSENATTEVCEEISQNIAKPLECLRQCRTQANASCAVGSEGTKLPCLFRESAKCILSCAPSNILPVVSNSSTVCPTQWEPVCASDGKTYANSCIAKSKGTEVVSEGRCSQSQGVTEDEAMTIVSSILRKLNISIGNANRQNQVSG